MTDLRNELAKARDAWFASDEGSYLLNTATLHLPSYAAHYLCNRLEAAFIAGWEALERTEQQRAPSKSQAKRIAAQKGESATAKKHDGPCWRNSHSDCGC